MAVITVSQLNNYIKRYIDANKALTSLWVKGEISNFKRHSSGHIYMTLKDGTATLKCVMFYSNAVSLKFKPDNGMKVIAMGRVSVYERDGVYQLYVEQLVPDGMGDLYAAYEQLKSELEQAGYFSEYIKKPIPEYPSSIGVVTSPQGAALQDILNIMGRRYPLAEVYVYPALVQGVGAAQSIAQGIEYFNAQCITDTIIIGRGGGSIEDLWAFNERIVADAIYKSEVPVISAVGHETDFTIADFAADLRAPTPSAAAELAVPDAAELKSHINYCRSKMVMSLNSLVKVKKTQLDFFVSKNLHKMTASYIDDMRLRIDDMTEMCCKAYTDCISQRNNEFINLCMKLDALSPLKVLSRGYTVATAAGGTVKSIVDICIGDNLDLTVTDGTISCTVTQITEN